MSTLLQSIRSALGNSVPARRRDRAIVAPASRPANFHIRNKSEIDGDVDYAIGNARKYINFLAEMKIELQGANVLELGPGINFGSQLILAGEGANCAVADRFLANWDNGYHPTFYRTLRDRWNKPNAALDAVIAEGGYPSAAIGRIHEPAERLHSVPDSQFDAVFSNAVLEHVYDPPAMVRTLARITRPGGVHFHQVDFRDHRNFDRPLEFLLVAEKEFAKVFEDAHGECGNQWRVSELHALFERAGFKVTTVGNKFASADYLSGFIPRLRTAQSRFSGWPEDDLRIISAYFVLEHQQAKPDRENAGRLDA